MSLSFNYTAMYRQDSRDGAEVKENVVVRYPMWCGSLLGGVAVCAAAMLLAAALDSRLPPPKTVHNAAPTEFIAENAMAHLINLTEIGPRVAGSYENEVLAKARIIESLRTVRAGAAAHNRVEWDVAAADGGFSLAFFDGLNSVYRGVRSVAARLRPAGGTPREAALLLNCHTDTVPDSPGASDDGAGCAVALEAARALVASPRPLRRNVLLLLNAAEENIMQGSHAFVTSHPWAKSARTFINLEACGAGGREILFQAGPHDPWLLEMYASLAPHPFGSSVAQELFESGLIPADTDFRVFRDFAKLSGLDFAWNSNGWVYHTRLDDVTRVPAAALQRTGDNVLALMHGVQQSTRPEQPAQDAGSPLYFDVGGLLVLLLGGRAAAAAALLLLLLLAARWYVDERVVPTILHTPAPLYRSLVRRALLAAVCGAGAGAVTSALAGAALHAAGATLPYYAHPALLVPLFLLPATCSSWAVSRYVFHSAGLGGRLRGDVVYRAATLATAALPAAGLVLGLVFRLRSALVPGLWSLAQLPHLLLGLLELFNKKAVSHGAAAAATLVGVCVPLVQGCSMAWGVLGVLLPLLGRAGTGLPCPNLVLGAVSAAAWCALSAWLLPAVLLARIPAKLWWLLSAVWVWSAAVSLMVPPYSATRPHRLMLFHTRRTIHYDAGAGEELFYWIPHLDVNTPHAAADYVPSLLHARATLPAECARHVYCGAPYYLPVMQLIHTGYHMPAPQPPLVTLRDHYAVEELDAHTVRLTATLDGSAHMMLIVSPIEGAMMTECDVITGPLQEAAPWGRRRTYFILLHRASPTLPAITLNCNISHNLNTKPPYWLDVSAAAHALFGNQSKSEHHRSIESQLPDWVAATGWGVDLHLYRL